MNPDISKLRIESKSLPKNSFGEHPGDLSKFAPSRDLFRDGEENSYRPIIDAPSHGASEGIVYFSNLVRKEDFEGFLRMMLRGNQSNEYAVFVQCSRNPLKDKYFTQMRIVPIFALRHHYNTINQDEYDTFPPQVLTIGEALWAFIEYQRDYVYNDYSSLSGKMGGDGDDAYESLSFGFMLENSYYSICRIWSRAWLVRK